MPRYYNAPQQQEEDPLQQLAAIMQIYGGFSHDQQRAQSEQQQNALGVLGLLMNQQHQQDQLGLQKSAQADESGRYWGGELPAKYAAQDLTRQDNEANRAIQQQGLDNRSGEFWGGTYPLAQQDSTNLASHQRALEAISKQNAETENNRYLGNQGLESAKMVLQGQKDQRDEALKTLGIFVQNPQVTSGQYPGIMKALHMEGADEIMHQAQETAANTHMQRLLPAFNLTYGGYSKDPTKAVQGMRGLWMDPGMQDPMVQERMREPIQALNEGLYHSNSTTPPPELNPNQQHTLASIQNFNTQLDVSDAQKALEEADLKKRQDAQSYIDSQMHAATWRNAKNKVGNFFQQWVLNQ